MPTQQNRNGTARRDGRQQRAALTEYVIERYEAGRSLMELSEETGRSFGYIRRLLLDAGVAMRPRGGSRGRRA